MKIMYSLLTISLKQMNMKISIKSSVHLKKNKHLASAETGKPHVGLAEIQRKAQIKAVTTIQV